MRHILLVSGSGAAGGNTAALAAAFADGARSAGHSVESSVLDGELNGCLGCGACRRGAGSPCVQHDMMDGLYPAFGRCDTLVLASPLYFWGLSARAKAFVERLYAISAEDRYPPRDCALLMTGGTDEFWAFDKAEGYFRFFTAALGWKYLGGVFAGGCTGCEGERGIDGRYLESARALGAGI